LTKASDEYAAKENDKIINARRKAIKGSSLHFLRGRRKKILHPIDLLRDLDGFWDFLFDAHYTPSLAAIAHYLGVSKDYIYYADRSLVSYSYYEILDHMGDLIDVLPIYATEEFDTTRHGSDIDISHVISIDLLIDNYEAKHLCEFTDEERNKIKSFQGTYIKRFHKLIISKRRYKNLVPLIRKFRAARQSKKNKNIRARIKKINAITDTPKYKDIYCTAITGSVIVAPSIKFGDVLQRFKTASEIEWQEIGKSARNPAMAIFILMNNCGYNRGYQNKQITEVRQSTSELEEAESQKRMDDLLEGELRLVEDTNEEK